MKFEDFKYERPNLEVYISKMNALLADLGSGKDYKTELEAVKNVFKLDDEISTQYTLVSIRNSVDTKDEFYEKEQDFMNEAAPKMQQYEVLFLKKILESAHRVELEKELGTQLFTQADVYSAK